MKNIIRIATLVVVASLATVACGATDGTSEGQTEQTEQAASACIPLGHTCEPTFYHGDCCQTCPAGEIATCPVSRYSQYTCGCKAE
jgi:hypothetical protein